jgi:gliding motility-associated-like protein
MIEDIVFYVPNAFTPDGDNFNQTFQPVFTSGFDPYDFNMIIYNRWGEKIFETHDALVGWNGTYLFSEGDLVQEGTYIWVIEFKNKQNDKHQKATGHVTLMR